MKLFRASAVLLLFSTAPNLAHARAQSPLAGMGDWVGHYPHGEPSSSDVKRGKSLNPILDWPPFRDALRKASGERGLQDLIAIKGPEVPVVRRGDWIRIWYCEAHNCGSENVVIYANVADSRLLACHHSAPIVPINARLAGFDQVYGPRPGQTSEFQPNVCLAQDGEDDWAPLDRLLGLIR